MVNTHPPSAPFIVIIDNNDQMFLFRAKPSINIRSMTLYDKRLIARTKAGICKTIRSTLFDNIVKSCYI